MNIGRAIMDLDVQSGGGVSKRPHYYGDTIRKLFFCLSFLNAFLYAFFTEYIPVTVRQGLLVVLAVSIFSGLTNPTLLDSCDGSAHLNRGSFYFWLLCSGFISSLFYKRFLFLDKSNFIGLIFGEPLF